MSISVSAELVWESSDLFGFKVYAEHLLEPLLQTIFALSGPKTTIMVWYLILFVGTFSSKVIMISFGGKFIQKYLSYFPSIFLKVGYEIRSTNVHEQMLNMWKQNFDLKIVPSSKVHIPFHLLAIYWLSNLCSQINVIQLYECLKSNKFFVLFCNCSLINFIPCRWTTLTNIQVSNFLLWV